MKHHKCWFSLAALAITLILALPLAGPALPAQAAVPWSQDPGPLSLESERYVTDTWVVKDGGTYEMWYSHGSTSLSISGIAQGITTLLTDAILTDLANFDLDGLLNDMAAIDIDALWDFLIAGAGIIGYATSADGISWTVVDPQVLGAGGTIFDSVGTPTVVKNGPTDYEMWYSHPRGALTKVELQAILADLDDGDVAVRKAALLDLLNSPVDTVIGYATSADGSNWTVVDPQVLAGDRVGLWDAVTAPCVVKTGGAYEMWHTYANINLVEADLDAILNDIANFDISDLMNILDSAFTRIGYSTSADGINWTAIDPAVLAGTNGIWDSVGTPSVVRNGSSYEMWYAHARSDLTGTDIQNLLAEIPGMGLSALFDLLEIPDINQFLIDVTDLIDNGLDTVKAILSDTGTRIGYATSADGATWTVQNSNALSGATASPWSSVAFPRVVYGTGVYEMWFTQGIDVLSAQNVVDVLQGDILPLGYATGFNLVAETSSSLGVDGGNIAIVVVNIDSAKNSFTGAPVSIPGGVSAYSALATFNPTGIELIDISGFSPFDGIVFDLGAGTFAVATVTPPTQPADTTVANIAPRLLGDALTQYDLTIAFQIIQANTPPEMNVTEEGSTTLTFLRGDASGNGTVSIADALAIAQYLVGIRTVDQIEPINAAGVVHGGAGGDTISIADALAIAQYLVGLRDANYE